MSAFSLICLCRFCAKEQTPETVIDLRKSTENRRSVLRKLDIYKEQIISFSDETLPETVCTECFHLIDSCYEFFIQVRRAQVILNKAVQACTDLEAIEEDSNPVSVKQESEDVYSENEYEDNEDHEVASVSAKEEEVDLPTQQELDFKNICIFCTKNASDRSEAKAAKISRRHNKVIKISKPTTKESIINFSYKIDDQWSKEVRDRILDVDLIAENGRYHKNCYGKFIQKRPGKAPRGRPENTKITEAMEAVCEYIEANLLNCQFTIKDIIKALPEVELPCPKTIKRRLRECYGSKMTNLGSDDSTMVITDSSWASYPWRCLHCPSTLPSMQQLRAHSSATHGRCFGFSCDDCDENTARFHAFILHVRRHRPHLKDYCQYCNVKMDSPAHIYTHIKMNCTYCGQTFTTKTELAEHIMKYANEHKNNSTSIDTENLIETEIDNLDPLEHDTKPNDRNSPQNIEVKPFTLNDQLITIDDKSFTIDDKQFAIDEKQFAIDEKPTDEFDTLQIDTDVKPFDECEEITVANIQADKQTDKKGSRDESIKCGKIETWSEYPNICKFCDRKMNTRYNLMKHSSYVHAKCFATKCVDCEQDESDTFVAFVEHVRGHRPILRNRCYYCDVETSSPDHLQTHDGPIKCTGCGLHYKNYNHFNKLHGTRTRNNIVINKMNQKYVCEICGKCLSKKCALTLHVERVHEKPRKSKNKRPPLTDFACDICFKRLKTKAGLKQHHITSHTKRTKDFTCERCGKTFYCEYNLKVHRRLHDAAKTELCKICGKYFKTTAQLKKHVKTHNLEMPFQCDHCKKYFSTKCNLRYHIAVHFDVKPNKCVYCSKSFRNKSTLRDHLRLHTGQRPYGCEDCGKYFACWASCEQHMRRHHGTSLRTTVQTAHGRLTLDPATGRPAPLTLTAEVRDWSRDMMKPLPRKPRTVEE